MRVLWVCHSGVVSAWRHGRVRALADQGVEVFTVSARRWNEGGALVEASRDPDESVDFAATFGSHPFGFVYRPAPLWRLLRGARFDVIDLHEEPASLAAAEVLTLVRRAGVTAPVVSYSAQNIYKRYPPPFRWLERRALQESHAVHTCNDAVASVLQAKGFTGEVANLGLGVDTTVFAPAATAPHASHEGGLHVGYVGRIEESKGIFTLLGAVEAVPEVSATYVGSGPDGHRLRSAIDARRLGNRVTVRGFVGYDDLPALYGRFDVLVAMSMDTPSWREQFGRVVIEAMAAGVPVIVSDAGALAEVADGAGIVLRERDARGLATALEALRTTPALRAGMRVRGLARAADFSWPAVARRQAGLYRRVAHSQRPITETNGHG